MLLDELWMPLADAAGRGNDDTEDRRDPGYLLGNCETRILDGRNG